MVVMVVTVTAYCSGWRTRTCPRQEGSFLAIAQYGRRERSSAPPSDQKTRFAGFVVRTRQCGPAGPMPSQRGPMRNRVEGGQCKPGCVLGSQVCTSAVRKTAREESSMLAQGCRRFAARLREIGQRDHQQICRPLKSQWRRGVTPVPRRKISKTSPLARGLNGDRGKPSLARAWSLRYAKADCSWHSRAV